MNTELDLSLWKMELLLSLFSTAGLEISLKRAPLCFGEVGRTGLEIPLCLGEAGKIGLEICLFIWGLGEAMLGLEGLENWGLEN